MPEKCQEIWRRRSGRKFRFRSCLSSLVLLSWNASDSQGPRDKYGWLLLRQGCLPNVSRGSDHAQQLSFQTAILLLATSPSVNSGRWSQLICPHLSWNRREPSSYCLQVMNRSHCWYHPWPRLRELILESNVLVPERSYSLLNSARLCLYPLASCSLLKSAYSTLCPLTFCYTWKWFFCGLVWVWSKQNGKQLTSDIPLKVPCNLQSKLLGGLTRLFTTLFITQDLTEFPMQHIEPREFASTARSLMSGWIYFCVLHYGLFLIPAETCCSKMSVLWFPGCDESQSSKTDQSGDYWIVPFFGVVNFLTHNQENMQNIGRSISSFLACIYPICSWRWCQESR